MTLAIEDVLNQALRDAGAPARINDIYEGTEAAKTALEIYTQARDELICDPIHDWSFPRRTLALTILKGPPPGGGFNPVQNWNTLYPPPGFLFEYAYPADCLDLRAVVEPPQLMPDLDPIPQLFRVDNDLLPNIGTGVAVGPPAKVILCNVNQAIGVYVGQVTDPNEWEPLFLSTLVASIGKKFARAFGADVNTTRELSSEMVATSNTAFSTRG